MEDILLSYLDRNGILLCNREADLPCLEDIGCAWGDVTALLDRQALFYCKLYRGRTTYLSREAYYLLRAVRGERKALTPAAARVYELLLQAPGAETDFLKPLSGLCGKDFRDGLNFLLRHLYATVVGNGTAINANWSTFRYAAAEVWEAQAPNVYDCTDPAGRLLALLGRTMPEKRVLAMIKGG